MSERRQPRPLSAFADGELDPQQSLEVLEQMSTDPQAARQVMHQQQLRQAVARAMDDPTGQIPAALRQRLTELAKTVPEPQPPMDSGPLARLGRWIPAAVAALLFIAAVLTFNASRDSSGPAPGIIPAAKVDEFAARHVACSRLVEALHQDPALPTSITELPEALAQRFGQGSPGLDLTPVGYLFDRVGACTVPGRGAVHLIYRAAPETGRDDSISLWLRSDDGRLKLEADKLYTYSRTTSGQERAHPLAVWRQGDLIYWVTGDSLFGVKQVVGVLRGV
jgi:anti-sigma factor RsiW